MPRSPLPSTLGAEFSIAEAHRAGVGSGRLRSPDLERPFRGARIRAASPDPAWAERSRFEAARDRELALIRALAARGIRGQFFTHRSAAMLLGMPMPHLEEPDLHLGVMLPERAPRIDGVSGHALPPHRCDLVEIEGIAATSPALTWVRLGELTLHQLVAAGDHLLRVHRPGYGRGDVGAPPLARLDELAAAVDQGRWKNTGGLRRALRLLRCDSWSPMESVLRVMIAEAGLPEPELNTDLFDANGDFLGCYDLVYRRYRVAIEYQGEGHAGRYAQDVERIERLRAEQWIVIEVTSELIRDPPRLIARIAAALRKHGWQA